MEFRRVLFRSIGACSLGGGQRCLDEAIAYTRDRKQFGQAIADFQATQFTLADMETRLQAARALLYSTAVKVTEGAADKTHFAAMAKRLATDEAMWRSEEHTSELQSLMRISYAVFCLKKKNITTIRSTKHIEITKHTKTKQNKYTHSTT